MHIETVLVIHGKKSALPIRFLNILTAAYCITEIGGGCRQKYENIEVSADDSC